MSTARDRCKSCCNDILGGTACVLAYTIIGIGLCIATILPPIVVAQMSLLLDHALAPEEVALSVDWRNVVSVPIPNMDERVQNNSAMPMNCSSILQTDVVGNISVTLECHTWCRETLGPGSAFSYAFSPAHYFIMSMMQNHTSQFRILRTCWKVETASWTLKWMPYVWLMYLYSLAYGFISAFTLLYLLCVNCPKESVYSRFLDGDSSESSGDSAGESSGVVASYGFGEGHNWALYFAVLGTLVEPGLDVLSVLTFLRNGQPYFAFYVIFGQLFSLRLSCDPFQLNGARAAAESLQQGFATKEFLEHKVIERWETLFSTIVQVYAVLTFDVGAVQVFTALNLMGGASFSILVSLPGQVQAVHILSEVAKAQENGSTIDLGDAQKVKELKAMQPWYWVLQRLQPLAMAGFAYVLIVASKKGPDIVLDGPVWDGWQVSILSVMVLIFRLMALASAPLFFIAFPCFLLGLCMKCFAPDNVTM